MNIPSTRGIEYAARRLWRIAAKEAFGYEPRNSWLDLPEAGRRGWRHLAMIIWIQPYTRKGAR